MSLGDISFIAAFVVFPLVIVALSIVALRTLSRRERRPLARFSSESPAESTQEMPMAQREEPHIRTETVQPVRGQEADEETERANAQTRQFNVPTYRGKSPGVVRRVMFRTRQATRPQESNTLDSTEAE